MAILSGFEVRIKSNGQYLTEYNDPASNAQDDGDEIDKYIEAVPGAQFSIEIAVTKKFGYAGADAVHAGYKIDGLKRRWYLFSNRRLGITPSHSLRDEAFIRKETGRCERAKFAFGQLSTVAECNDQCSAVDFGKGEWLGKISIVFYRVTVVPKPPSRLKDDEETLVSTVPEKLLKGKAIDRTVNMVEGVSCEIPMSAPWRPSRLRGREGRARTITFFYRSRRALQVIGCIPRDPSPPITPVPAATDDDVVEVDRKATVTRRQTSALEQELRELRTRLRELEGRETSSKRETTPLKRERSLEDIYGSTPKRGRSKVVAPVIDLTED